MNEPVPTHQVTNDIHFAELLRYQLTGVPVITITYATGLCVAVVSLFLSFSNPSAEAVIALLFAIFITAGIPIALSVAYKKNEERMRDITTTITPENLVSRCNSVPSELRIEWSRVASVTTSSRLIIFKLVPPLTGTICIPFRCFGSDEEANKFLQDSFAYWKAGQSKKHDAGKCLPATAQDKGFWTTTRARLVLALVPAAGGIFLLQTESLNLNWAPWIMLTVIIAAIAACKYLQNGDGDVILANGAFAKGNHRKALDISLKALKKYPQHANLHCVAAAAYSGLGRMEECIFHCNEALKIAPDSAFAYGNRSLAFREMCQFENALADSRKSLEIEPNLAGVVVFRAACQLDLGQYDEGLKSCDEALVIDGRYVGAYMMKANIMLRLNRLEESINAAEKALELALKGPNKTEQAGCHILLANIHAEVQDLPKATEHLNKALAIDPKDGIACSTAAHVYCIAGQIDPAREMYKKALIANPSPRVQANITSDAALIEYKDGNIDAADKLASESLQILKRSYSLAVKALIQLRQSDLQSALQTSNEAVEFDSHHAMSYWIRHLVQEKMGDAAGAQADREVAESYGYKPHFK